MADFAQRRVQIDINANDSNIALHTRSKVRLPDNDIDKKKKQYERDEEYDNFLRKLYVEPNAENSQDEDFEVNENSQSPSKLDHDYSTIRISKRMVRDLNDNSNSSHSSKQSENNNYKKVRAHFRVPFHKKHRELIKNQLSQLFQLLIIVRHLSLNSSKYRMAHILCTQLLLRLNESRLGAIQSIRFAVAKRCGIFNKYSQKINQYQANHIATMSTDHLNINSMLDIPGIEEYFAFNGDCTKSYASILNRFRDSWLEEKYIPSVFNQNNCFDEKEEEQEWTEIEEKLLCLGVNEYGQESQKQKFSNNNKNNNNNNNKVMINDWTSIRDRFLPNKTIKSLQLKMAKGDLKFNFKLKSKQAIRKEMNDRELSLLIKGIEKYGLKSWRKIEKEFIPCWSAIDLSKKYFSKLRPLIKTMQINVTRNSNKVTFFNPKIDDNNNNNNNQNKQESIYHYHNYRNLYYQSLNANNNHNDNDNHDDNDNNDKNDDDDDLDILQPLFCETASSQIQDRNKLDPDGIANAFECVNDDAMDQIKAILEEQFE